MSWIILLLILMVMLVLRQSLVLVFAVAAAYIHVFIANSKLEFLLQDFWFTVDREVLLSIPLFILAGNVMSRGSIAQRLIGFMTTITSPIPGGMGIACVLSCAAFAAINGSSIVTMLAIGSVMYPAMVSRGYSKHFALGAVASAGTLGIIIPPSIPLILYGIMTEKNIAHLFVAGIGPGLLLTLFFAGYSFVVNRNIARERYTRHAGLEVVHRRHLCAAATDHHHRRHLLGLFQPDRICRGGTGLRLVHRILRAQAREAARAACRRWRPWPASSTSSPAGR